MSTYSMREETSQPGGAGSRAVGDPCLELSGPENTGFVHGVDAIPRASRAALF